MLRIILLPACYSNYTSVVFSILFQILFGIFGLGFSLGLVCLATRAVLRSLGMFRLDLYAPEVSFGIFLLGTVVQDLALCMETLAP